MEVFKLEQRPRKDSFCESVTKGISKHTGWIFCGLGVISVSSVALFVLPRLFGYYDAPNMLHDNQLNYNHSNPFTNRRFVKDMTTACKNIALTYGEAGSEDLVPQKTSYGLNKNGKDFFCYSELTEAACKNRENVLGYKDGSLSMLRGDAPEYKMCVPVDAFSPFLQKILSVYFQNLPCRNSTTSIKNNSLIGMTNILFCP